MDVATDSGETESEPELDAVHPSEAFGDLGNEVRTEIVETLFEAARDGADPPTFSDLFEASSAENTAGFAYHLRQLAGRYVEKTEDGYRLTYAGERAASAVASGTFTESHDVDPIAIEDSCPHCDETGLFASGSDNHVTVACAACERGVLTLPFPPGGHRTDDPEGFLAAFDRHHRHRLSSMSDGVCPECAASVDATIEPAGGDEREDGQEPATAVQLHLDCPECGCRLRCPVTLAVLDHPAVVSFFHDHDADLRERPLWNVGSEWTETLLSTDPWCVLVTCRLDDERLEVYVSRDLSVVETRRRDGE